MISKPLREVSNFLSTAAASSTTAFVVYSAAIIHSNAEVKSIALSHKNISQAFFELERKIFLVMNLINFILSMVKNEDVAAKMQV